MSWSIEIEMPDLQKVADRDSKEIIRELTIESQREMQALMLDSEPSGEEYQRGKSTHKASAAGEAPAVDSGNLAGTMVVSFNDLIGEIDLAEHGEYLEDGTEFIEPRPFILPSIEAVLKRL